MKSIPRRMITSYDNSVAESAHRHKERREAVDDVPANESQVFESVLAFEY